MSLSWESLNIDARAPRELARWWADLLGWSITAEEDDLVVIEPPPDDATRGTPSDIVFARVPESKQVKNRLHIDLRPDDQELEVARAISLGARRIDVGQDERATWVVLADPEGNEFCILSASPAIDRT